MGDAVHPDGMEAGVTEEYLEKVLGSRVPFDDSVDVFSQPLEHITIGYEAYKAIKSIYHIPLGFSPGWEKATFSRM